MGNDGAKQQLSNAGHGPLSGRKNQRYLPGDQRAQQQVVIPGRDEVASYDAQLRI